MHDKYNFFSTSWYIVLFNIFELEPEDLFKFIANGERNKSRKIDTSKDISESEFKAVINIIEKTIEESIFDGAFEEMEDEIMGKLMEMREVSKCL